MGIDVTPIFAEHLARKRGPDPRAPGHRQTPDYGIVASLEGDVLEVERVRPANPVPVWTGGGHGASVTHSSKGTELPSTSDSSLVSWDGATMEGASFLR